MSDPRLQIIKNLEDAMKRLKELDAVNKILEKKLIETGLQPWEIQAAVDAELERQRHEAKPQVVET